MPTKEYLMPEEASLIEDAALCLRDKLLIRLLRRLAGRVTEVLGIEEKNIDFSRRQIKIEHKKARITRFCPYCDKEDIKTRLGKKFVVCPRCTHPVDEILTKQMEVTLLRKLPVDRDTLQLIREYIKKGGVTEVGEKRVLFTFSRQWAWHIVVECAEKAGYFELENPKNERKHHVHPHSFRDAFVINAMKKKPTQDDARLIQEMLGHQNINTTMAYRKVAGAELQEFYDDLLKEDSGAAPIKERVKQEQRASSTKPPAQLESKTHETSDYFLHHKGDPPHNLDWLKSNFPNFADFIPTLRGRERMVIVERLKGKTLEGIGQEEGFHVTRERVRQIEAKACRKLAYHMRRHEKSPKEER